jgi:hypothetical protein
MPSGVRILVSPFEREQVFHVAKPRPLLPACQAPELNRVSTYRIGKDATKKTGKTKRAWRLVELKREKAGSLRP